MLEIIMANPEKFALEVLIGLGLAFGAAYWIRSRRSQK